jgi:hypothetical protein
MQQKKLGVANLSSDVHNNIEFEVLWVPTHIFDEVEKTWGVAEAKPCHIAASATAN